MARKRDIKHLKRKTQNCEASCSNGKAKTKDNDQEICKTASNKKENQLLESITTRYEKHKRCNLDSSGFFRVYMLNNEEIKIKSSPSLGEDWLHITLTKSTSKVIHYIVNDKEMYKNKKDLCKRIFDEDLEKFDFPTGQMNSLSLDPNLPKKKAKRNDPIKKIQRSTNCMISSKSIFPDTSSPSKNYKADKGIVIENGKTKNETFDETLLLSDELQNSQTDEIVEEMIIEDGMIGLKVIEESELEKVEDTNLQAEDQDKPEAIKDEISTNVAFETESVFSHNSLSFENEEIVIKEEKKKDEVSDKISFLSDDLQNSKGDKMVEEDEIEDDMIESLIIDESEFKKVEDENLQAEDQDKPCNEAIEEENSKKVTNMSSIQAKNFDQNDCLPDLGKIINNLRSKKVLEIIQIEYKRYKSSESNFNDFISFCKIKNNSVRCKEVVLNEISFLHVAVKRSSGKVKGVWDGYLFNGSKFYRKKSQFVKDYTDKGLKNYCFNSGKFKTNLSKERQPRCVQKVSVATNETSPVHKPDSINTKKPSDRQSSSKDEIISNRRSSMTLRKKQFVDYSYPIEAKGLSADESDEVKSSSALDQNVTAESSIVKRILTPKLLEVSSVPDSQIQSCSAANEDVRNIKNSSNKVLPNNLFHFEVFQRPRKQANTELNKTGSSEKVRLTSTKVSNVKENDQNNDKATTLPTEDLLLGLNRYLSFARQSYREFKKVNRDWSEFFLILKEHRKEVKIKPLLDIGDEWMHLCIKSYQENLLLQMSSYIVGQNTCYQSKGEFEKDFPDTDLSNFALETGEFKEKCLPALNKRQRLLSESNPPQDFLGPKKARLDQTEDLIDILRSDTTKEQSAEENLIPFPGRQKLFELLIIMYNDYKKSNLDPNKFCYKSREQSDRWFFCRRVPQFGPDWLHVSLSGESDSSRTRRYGYIFKEGKVYRNKSEFKNDHPSLDLSNFVMDKGEFKEKRVFAPSGSITLGEKCQKIAEAELIPFPGRVVVCKVLAKMYSEYKKNNSDPSFFCFKSTEDSLKEFYCKTLPEIGRDWLHVSINRSSQKASRVRDGYIFNDKQIYRSKINFEKDYPNIDLSDLSMDTGEFKTNLSKERRPRCVQKVSVATNEASPVHKPDSINNKKPSDRQSSSKDEIISNRRSSMTLRKKQFVDYSYPIEAKGLSADESDEVKSSSALDQNVSTESSIVERILTPKLLEVSSVPDSQTQSCSGDRNQQNNSNETASNDSHVICKRKRVSNESNQTDKSKTRRLSSLEIKNDEINNESGNLPTEKYCFQLNVYWSLARRLYNEFKKTNADLSKFSINCKHNDKKLRIKSVVELGADCIHVSIQRSRGKTQGKWDSYIVTERASYRSIKEFNKEFPDKDLSSFVLKTGVFKKQSIGKTLKPLIKIL